MTEHTPGPWRVAPPSRGHKIVTADGGKVIGEANFYNEQAFANQQLMAAAPDLLEALECLLPGLILDLRYADDDDDKDAMRSRIKTVTDALAKTIPPSNDSGAKP